MPRISILVSICNGYLRLAQYDTYDSLLNIVDMLSVGRMLVSFDAVKKLRGAERVCSLQKFESRLNSKNVGSLV